MSSSANPYDLLRSRTERYCDGTLSAEDAEIFERQLRDDPESMKIFLLYMEMHSQIAWNIRAHAANEESETSTFEEAALRLVVKEAESSVDPSFVNSYPSSVPPIVIDPSPAVHSSIGNFLFSHIAAAVILGIGLLIGLAWRISLPSPEGTGGTGYASVVARITALAGCQWSKQGSGVRGRGPGISKTEDQRPKTISLGDRLLVSSGLMEITYDTGAKVILEGPCTYEIDSDRSGYLAIGRLTARIVASGQWPVASKTKQRKHEAESLATDHRPLTTALFAVRTPTAVVTDLGTEFGVEVEKTGATRSHVFQGSVSIVPAPNGRGGGGEGKTSRRFTTSGESVEILHAGQSARVERGRNSKVVVIHEPGQSDCFVRQIPSSFIPHPSSFDKSHALAPGPQSLPPRYRLTDLGTLGGKTSCAHAINNSGVVVGEADVDNGATHAFLCIDGKMSYIGVLHENSWAVAINNSDQVVGGFGTDRDASCRAFFYGNGAVRVLGTLGGQSACANAINDTGQIAGVSRNANDIERACLFGYGKQTTDLGALGGAQAESGAYGINNAGVVAGRSETRDGRFHTFMYRRGIGMEDLGVLELRHRFCSPHCINNAGQIVGFSGVDRDQRRAFLHARIVGMKDLGTLGGPRSMAMDINNAGQIVGTADGFACESDACQVHAFLHDDGKIIDLNSFINPALGWRLVGATGINDSGQIVGYGIAPDGSQRAFLLTPLMEGRGAGDEERRPAQTTNH